MQCPRCQHENPPGSNFCLGCGTCLGATCGRCGTNLPAGSRFCNKCGTPVSGEPAGQARFASPESYTPKHLAEKILTSKAALEGERKQVTVLFADLKGSMELLADRDPEEARKVLDPVLELMMEAVHRYEGTVNQVMGDGIMALFGAPIAHEDHAVRACYAAFAIQQAAERYAEQARRIEGFRIRVRIGLNSGEVVVRAIRNDLHMDYTAVGQTTHLAARMEQIADPGTVLITGSTLALAEGFVDVIPLGPTPVKGLEAPVDVFELKAASAMRSRLHAAATRGLTRFVGRDVEIDLLHRSLERAGAGHGQVVAVVGEPGVGKSRLFYELTHSHRTRGWLIVEGGSVSYGKATPYLPVVDLLRKYFGVENRDDPRRVRERIVGKILTLDRTLEPDLSALLALLDVPVDDTAWQGADAVQRRQRTLDTVKRVLLAEAHRQPVLLVVEDLHWIDTETQALVDSLIESLPKVPVLLLVNYRPEFTHGWSGKTYYSQIQLDALAGESADDLLDALIGREPVLEPLKRTLLARTAGNPFFIEESVRTLVETGALTGERGAYRPTQEMHTMQVPATVQAVLAARIDRLPGEAKALLQAASVVGKDVPFELLRAVADMHDGGLRSALAQLQSSEFLYEVRLFPDLEYTFKHALTHEVTYAGVLHERRRALHARIVAAIEALHGDRLAEHVESLAHHAFRGEDWERASRFLREAGAKALARSANREATVSFRRALDALTRLPRGRETTERGIDLRLDLYNALLPLDEVRSVLGDLREAETLAVALGDRRRLGLARLCISHILILIDDTRASVQVARDVVAIAEDLGDEITAARAYLWLGCGSYALGQHRSAAELVRRGFAPMLESSERVNRPSGYLAMFLAELGEFDEAERAAQMTIQSPLNAPERPWNFGNASWQIAWFWCLKGDLDQAAPLAERAVAIHRQWGFRRTLGTSASLLGHIFALSGRVGEAVDLLEQGVREADTFEATWLRCPRLQFLGEAYLLAGRVEQAKRTADHALSLARERRERGFEAWILRLEAEISGASGRSDEADAVYRAALAGATELEMRPLIAHCHLGLGRLYQRTGTREQAQEHVATAATMYREMDMRFWLEKSEAEMKEYT
jgi:class 3 adenylate cyclase/tetratricopeptide (TPR) repeat protein